MKKVFLIATILIAGVISVKAQEGFKFGAGVRLALPVGDFGTGYSSLSYLRILPFDQIKIDKSFIEGILENRTDAFIVSSVLQLGHLIGINVIAEGIETSQQYDLLRSLGCTGFQGYLFGKPMPLAEFESHLKHKSSCSCIARL